MLFAEIPKNETARLQYLKKLDILDTLEEEAYDDLTLIASQICNTPIALISLMDEKRQWFKSHYGLNDRETPRDISLCSHAILSDDLFIVENTDLDERFCDNPLVTSGPKFKFYAGAPLIIEKGIRIGTLCVLDTKASSLTEAQKLALAALSRQVVALLNLRLSVKKLKKLDHVKDEFLSMVSHELRTPLTSLKGSLDIIEHFGNKSMSTLLDVAKRNTNQLIVIVNDILDLASMQAGTLRMDMQKLNVVALLDSAIELNEIYTEKLDCKIMPLDVDDEQKQINVFADEGRLLQVLTNLISNAAKFGAINNPQIHISLRKDGERVHISVIDNGPGIQYEFSDQVFTKFQQIDSAKNQKLPGTGLGLAICKHIVKAHNGEIGFHSEPNVRTEFFVKLAIVN